MHQPAALYNALAFVADAVNPTLAVVALTQVALGFRRGQRRALLLMALPAALGVLGIYAVKFLDEMLMIWQRYHGDYSTHTAFATTLVLSLVVWRPRWKAALVGTWLAYLGLILFMGYHTLRDVVTAVVVAVAVTVPWHWLMKRYAKIRQPL